MARSFGAVNSDQLASATTLVAGNTGTISIWVKPNWNSGDSVQRYLWTADVADSPGFQRFSDNNIYAGFSTGGNTRVIIADTGLFVSGVWAHWVLTWSSGAGQTLYQNGVSKGTSAYANFSNTMTQMLTGNIGVNKSFNGSIADHAMWSVILSAAEISALATGARPSMVRPKSLQYWIPIDGLQSPEPDLSGNAHNATVTGTAFAFGPPTTMFTPRWPISTISVTPTVFNLMPQACL